MHLRRPYLNVRVTHGLSHRGSAAVGARPSMLVLSNAQDAAPRVVRPAARAGGRANRGGGRRVCVPANHRRLAARAAPRAARGGRRLDPRAIRRAQRWPNSIARGARAARCRPRSPSMLQGSASRLLRDIVGQDPVYREILLTDRAGRLAAVSGVSTDYDQSDEDWWRAAFDESALGRVTVSDVRWDESARVYALEIAAPVPETSGAGTAGILKVVADVRELLAAVAGGSGDARCSIRKDGSIVFSRRAPAPGGRFFANDGLQAHLARSGRRRAQAALRRPAPGRTSAGRGRAEPARAQLSESVVVRRRLAG